MDTRPPILHMYKMKGKKGITQAKASMNVAEVEEFTRGSHNDVGIKREWGSEKVGFILGKG